MFYIRNKVNEKIFPVPKPFPAEEETDEKPSPLGEGGTDCRMRGRANGKATVNEYPKYSPAVAHRQSPKNGGLPPKSTQYTFFPAIKAGV